MPCYSDSDDDDALSEPGSDTSFGSHRSYLSNYECEECLKTCQSQNCSLVVPYRDDDFAKMKENFLAFMMEARRRQSFPLLALSVEVRFLILSELLYWHEPLNFNVCNDFCYCRNFSFHTQILATCHQLQEEGSAILMRRNVFAINLYGDEFHTDTMEWMGFVSTPSINSQMAHWDRFKSFSKLTINIKVKDRGDYAPPEHAAGGHRLLVYGLVEKILSRTKLLSSLSVVCSLQLWKDDIEFALYRVEGDSAEQIEDDGPLTVEQYMLEPLVNLKGAADVCNFAGTAADCEEFFDRRTEPIDYGIHRTVSVRSTTES
jgi:hypothetical protein